MPDHCAIVLKPSYTNWGPRPFRVLNCWLQNCEFDKLFSKKWNGLQVAGWDSFVVKEKLKMLRHDLMEWNRLFIWKLR